MLGKVSQRAFTSSNSRVIKYTGKNVNVASHNQEMRNE